VAVGPDGAYAGALWVPASREAEALTTLAAGDDAALAAAWLARGVAGTVTHGELARHPATKARLVDVEEAESRLDISSLTQLGVEKAEVEEFRFPD
jgi:hypothetical protein